MKPTLSLVILTHNSTELLVPVLSEYSEWIDQLIFIDNYSADDVAELAKKYSAKLVRRNLENNFAAQRNAAFEHVASDWTLFLDSDEYISAELWQEIHQAITAEVADAIVFPRKDIFLGKTLQYGETGQMYLLRAARTKLGTNKWRRAVHEVWELPATATITTHHALIHNPHPNLAAFLQKLHWYASLEPSSREKYSMIRILLELLFYPPAKFFLNYVLKGGWRDGMAGFIHAICMAYYSLITRVYLYEEWHA